MRLFAPIDRCYAPKQRYDIVIQVACKRLSNSSCLRRHSLFTSPALSQRTAAARAGAKSRCERTFEDGTHGSGGKRRVH